MLPEFAALKDRPQLQALTYEPSFPSGAATKRSTGPAEDDDETLDGKEQEDEARGEEDNELDDADDVE